MSVVLSMHALVGTRGEPAFDLQVRVGETVVLSGLHEVNRRGLIRATIGLTKPDSGRSDLLGIDPVEASRQEANELRARCGVLLAGVALISNLNVFDNLALPLRYHQNLTDAVIHGRVMAALERAEAVKLAQLRPAQLRREQRSVLGLVRATISNPQVVVLEEPFDGLDEQEGAILRKLIEHQLQFKCGLLVMSDYSKLETSFNGQLLRLPNTRVLHTPAAP